VIPVVVGSNPIGHPIPSLKVNPPRTWRRPGIAAGATARDAFVANVRAALEQIDANSAGAADGRDPEYLHQLRIGLRRLRSALRAFRSLLSKRDATDLDRELREILRAFGGARDWDVFRRSGSDERLVQAAQRRYAPARRRAREMLRSAHFRTTLHRALAWAKTAPWRRDADPDERIEVFARRSLRRLQDRLREDAEGIDWRDAVQRHRVRVKAKRLRYGCECFAAAYQKHKMRPYLKRLRKLQQILGEMNDITVQSALLHELARSARLRRPAAILRAALSARERELIAEAAQAWSELESAKPFWRRAVAVRAEG
jgi:triphosphatase